MKLAALLLFFILTLIPTNAYSFYKSYSWAFHGSIFYWAANNGIDSDPAPILPSAGFSAAWNFWGPLRLEFTEDLYMTNYEYNTTLGYAMACNVENRSAFVMGFLTAIQLAAFFPVGHTGTGVRLYGGPAADLRLITLAFGLDHPDDAQLQTNAIREYFWSKGRWLYPVFGTGMDFPINDRFLLGFDLRTWFPIYRLWTDKHLPAIDGWRFGVGFRISTHPVYITPRPPRPPRPPRAPRTPIEQPAQPDINEPQLETETDIDVELDVELEIED